MRDLTNIQSAVDNRSNQARLDLGGQKTTGTRKNHSSPKKNACSTTTVLGFLQDRQLGRGREYTDFTTLRLGTQGFARLSDELENLLPQEAELQKLVDTYDSKALQILAQAIKPIHSIQEQAKSRFEMLEDMEETSVVIRHKKLKIEHQKAVKDLKDLHQDCKDWIDIIEICIPNAITFGKMLNQGISEFNRINQTLLLGNHLYQTPEDHFRVTNIPNNLSDDDLNKLLEKLKIKVKKFSNAASLLKKSFRNLEAYCQNNNILVTTALTNKKNYFHTEVLSEINALEEMRKACYTGIEEIYYQFSNGCLDYIEYLQGWLLDNSGDAAQDLKTTHKWARAQLITNQDLQDILIRFSGSESSESSEFSSEEMSTQDLEDEFEKILLKDWQEYIDESSQSLRIG